MYFPILGGIQMPKCRVIATCTGIVPLLSNAPPPGLLMSLAKGVTPPKRKGADVDLKEICEEKVYLDDGGWPCIPVKNMFAALKFAGKFVKLGKKNITSGDSTLLPSILQVEGTVVRLHGASIDEKPSWVMDMCAGRHRQGQTKVMVALVRPRFDVWGFTASVICEDEEATLRIVRDLFIQAGEKSGLGDYRPSSSGFNGIFRVTRLQKQPIKGVIEKPVEYEVLEAATA